MATTPTQIQTTPGTSQPIIIRAPNLTPVASTPQGQPQQTTTFVISPSLPQVPIAQAPQLQPRLIQIRPRTPLSTTATPTSTVTNTNITSVARPNASVPIILPAVSTGGVTVASGLQPQPRIIVANAGLRPVAPAGQNAQNQQQQQGYTRIIPRLPLAPTTGPTTVQKQISSQPVTLMAQPFSREGLNLTPTQVTSIQSLFQGANRLSRLDKATILSFISGKAVNPQPESGTAQRIRLSEYRERVIDKESGNPMEVAVDTFLLLDYATGRFESVKSYRTLPPDQLMALPVQPKVVSTTTFVTTTIAMTSRDSNNTNITGPMTRSEYEEAFRRRDKRSLHELVAEEEAIIDNEAADFETAEKEAIAAASSAWVPLTPQYIDSHFQLWSLSRKSGDVYEGVQLPGDAKWRVGGARSILNRDFNPDMYEEDLFEMKHRASAELKEGIGELSPVQYAIHVQSTPTYQENMVISSFADEYYYLAGHIGWVDLHDSGLAQRLRTLMLDPFLVGLRHDVTHTDANVLIDPDTDNAFSAIEQNNMPFDVAIGPHQLRHACHLAYKHPRLKLVLNHCGLPLEYTSTNPDEEVNIAQWKADLEYLSRYPNVYCKLTATSGKIVSSYGDGNVEEKEWSPKNVLTQAIGFFGPERCLFGSGWPICRVVAPAVTGWSDSGTGGALVAAKKHARISGPPVKGYRGQTVAHRELSVWEAARLVEHCMEEAGFGAIEDKRKVFGTNAQTVYTLNIRPYGSSRVL
ncbi:unnamed protein product [Hymenolepis diminuta]|uniref:Amidohydro-rel domain-containing protein n=2 Tax=Hymenolepis diminuta TaxID=6216 RepID=A0A0R3SH30_HYMDI|nr:unnamed protein product [Hymenolepis diminuta]